MGVSLVFSNNFFAVWRVSRLKVFILIYRVINGAMPIAPTEDYHCLLMRTCQVFQFLKMKRLEILLDLKKKKLECDNKQGYDCEE